MSDAVVGGVRSRVTALRRRPRSPIVVVGVASSSNIVRRWLGLLLAALWLLTLASTPTARVTGGELPALERSGLADDHPSSAARTIAVEDNESGGVDADAVLASVTILGGPQVAVSIRTDADGLVPVRRHEFERQARGPPARS